MRNRKTLLLFVFILAFILISGCKEKNSIGDETQTTVSAKSVTVDDSYGFTLDIKDFYIETDIKKPLVTAKVSDNSFYRLLSEIEFMYSMDSDQFRIFHLLNYCENPSFREIDLGSRPHYYTILEKDNGDRCIPVFTSGYPKTWVCSEYLVLDKDDQPISYSVGSNNAETKRAHTIMSQMSKYDLAE